MKNITKVAFLHALATAVYIIAIASLLYYAPHVFGRAESPLVPIAMLMLFVFSAALTGYLVFGKPALLYFDGKKKEAIELLMRTLLILFVITVLAFVKLAILAGNR